jgi:putative NADPH-quinone reductase
MLAQIQPRPKCRKSGAVAWRRIEASQASAMGKRILIIQGHPDRAGGHFCHALADAYAEAAGVAGHEVRRVEVALLDFPLLRSATEWNSAEPPEALRSAQADIGWAEHIVFEFPLWLGTLPALFKGFLEQVLRPGFATPATDKGNPFRGPLRGRSARVIVTMGMPGLFFRLFFRSHGVRVLKRNILHFCGIRPVRETLIGMVEGPPAGRSRALERVRAMGRSGL